MGESNYIHRLRVRVGGVCIENERILLVKLRNFGSVGYFWLPPGGGVHFGESLENALRREFAEETGLQIAVGRFICTNQVIRPPLHAIEFFFHVKIIGGVLQSGSDPELPADRQMIEQATWLSWEEISRMPPEACHNLFRHCRQLSDFLQLQGVYSFD